MRWSYRSWLLVLFLAILTFGCIDAASYNDLALQHAPTVALLSVLIATRQHRLSNTTYTCLFAFLTLHVIGARHLYSFVPYDDWSQTLIGLRPADLFGFERNHYDRLVHFSFGLLVLYPASEVARRTLKLTKGASLIVGVLLIATLGAAYELLEWGVAVVMSPENAEKYNGQQGDPWDAHWDMLLEMSAATVVALALWFLGLRSAPYHSTLKPAVRMAP